MVIVKFLRAHVWPISFAVLAVLVFFFYQWILPEMSAGAKAEVGAWMPMTAINEALIWVIMALGLNVVVGYAGLLDLGYVAFWAIGAYCAGWFMSSFLQRYEWADLHILAPPGVPSTAPGIHISFWLVLIIAAVVCAIFGVLIGAPTLRLRSDYLAIVTLGFGEIIPEFFKNSDDVFGINVANGDEGINPVDPIGTGFFSELKGIQPTLGVFEHNYRYLVFVLLVAICILVSLQIRTGRLGRAWLAIREDELAASMMGVPLMRTKLAAYAVGAFFGGLGGVAYAVHVNSVFPVFSFNNSIIILLMVVVGGMGNVWGVTIGAFLLAWINSVGLRQIGTTVNDSFGTEIDFVKYNFLIFGIILVLMMLFRREGLLPESRTRQILREPARTEMEAVGADIEAAEIEVTEEAHAPVGDDEGRKEL